MSTPNTPILPTKLELTAELERDERSEHRLLIRQIAIILFLAALLATRTLLS